MGVVLGYAAFAGLWIPVSDKLELDMIELKRRTNELSCQFGREPPDALGFLDAQVLQPVPTPDPRTADAPT